MELPLKASSTALIWIWFYIKQTASIMRWIPLSIFANLYALRENKIWSGFFFFWCNKIWPSTVTEDRDGNELTKMRAVCAVLIYRGGDFAPGQCNEPYLHKWSGQRAYAPQYTPRHHVRYMVSKDMPGGPSPPPPPPPPLQPQIHLNMECWFMTLFGLSSVCKSWRRHWAYA